MAERLALATPAERRQIYAEAGVHLTYTRRPDGTEAVRAEVRGEMSRVGEGISTVSPRAPLAGLFLAAA